MHFLVGARQIGKTTPLKIHIHRLLERGHEPKSIFYYSCDEIVDHRDLGELIDSYLSARKEWGIRSS
ncbi:AAA family ATPase [Candidatus Pyrohabitans sp.]